MPTNTKIDPALVTELAAAGKRTDLDMDGMVAQIGFPFVTNNLFMGNDGKNNYWHYKGSLVKFATPESAVAYNWLNKPL